MPSIKILQQSQGALRARGIAVIIDVLRAFTTVYGIAAAGARQILAAARQETVLRLNEQYPRAILVGERNGRRIAGFDAGNSPFRAQGIDWQGRDVIFTTSNGTRGLIAARNAQQVLCGSFINAGAIVTYIRQCAQSSVSLVCMGSAGRPALEDTLCAHYLRGCLLDTVPAFEPLRQRIMAGRSAAAFLRSDCPDMPPEDLDLCLALNRFGFVLRAVAGPAGSVALERVEVY